MEDVDASVRRDLRLVGCAIGRRAAVAWLLVVGLFAFVPLAGADDGVRFSIDQVTVSQDGSTITAFVSVLDADGKPIGGVTDFETAIDGTAMAPEAVTQVIDQDRGIAVLLLLDISGSMEGEPLARAKEAASAFVGGLEERDVAALIPFAGQVHNQTLFSTNRSALLAQIAATEVERNTGTALYDAVTEGVTATAARAPTERRAVILLTDGLDAGPVSQHSRSEALDSAAARGIPIFAVALGGAADADLLQELARVAGGGFYSAPTPAELPSIFQLIEATLRSQYAIQVALPDGGDASREFSVSVEIDGGTYSARSVFQAGPPSSNAKGGTSSFVLLGGLGVGLLFAVSIAIVAHRHRIRRPAIAGGRGSGAAIAIRASNAAPDGGSAFGSLTVLEGPNSGASVTVGNHPIEIGSDPSCRLRLQPVSGDVAGTHVRVWLQGGRLMLHHLARSHETLVDGRAVEWASLGDEDTLQVGPYLLRFALPEVPITERDSPEAGSIRGLELT